MISFFIYLFLEISIKSEIVLGPIIGYVTNTTSRILIEFDKIEEIELALCSKDNCINHNKQLVNSFVPTLFKFNDLIPNTKYSLSIPSKNYLKFNSSFTTLSNDNNSLNLAFVSCNDYKLGNYYIWESLNKKILNSKINYLFHLGDQVYTDSGSENIYSKALILFNSKQNSSISSTIRELIRTLYRNTWTVPETAQVLANIPNIMLLDDHEVYDDFGFIFKDDEFHKIFSFEARYCYYEYQKQLREDIDFNNINLIENEHYYFNLNGISIFAFEFRSHKEWRNNGKSLPIISEQQQKDFILMFEKGGLYSENKIAIIVSPIPIWLWEKQYLQMTVSIHPEFNDYLEYWINQDENLLYSIIEILRNWKSNSNDKKIIFVGGDIHASGNTEIYYKGQEFAKQIVSSGANSKTHIIEDLMTYFFNLLPHKFMNDYEYIHHNWEFDKNYAILEITQSTHSKTKINSKSIFGEKCKETIIDHDNYIFKGKLACYRRIYCRTFKKLFERSEVVIFTLFLILFFSIYFKIGLKIVVASFVVILLFYFL